ncbi:hypothetical protein LXL04_024617 [Taraxacum kok-saghyz]
MSKPENAYLGKVGCLNEKTRSYSKDEGKLKCRPITARRKETSRTKAGQPDEIELKEEKGSSVRLPLCDGVAAPPPSVVAVDGSKPGQRERGQQQAAVELFSGRESPPVKVVEPEVAVMVIKHEANDNDTNEVHVNGNNEVQKCKDLNAIHIHLQSKGLFDCMSDHRLGLGPRTWSVVRVFVKLYFTSDSVRVFSKTSDRVFSKTSQTKIISAYTLSLASISKSATLQPPTLLTLAASLPTRNSPPSAP